MKFIVTVFLLIAAGQVFSQAKLDSNFIKLVDEEGTALRVNEPSQQDPVAVNAKLVWNKDKTQMAVIVKAAIFDGWHIYAFVPETEPYIVSEMVLEIPDNFTSISDWNMPRPFPSEDGVLVFKDDNVFTRFYSVNNANKKGEAIVGLYYQTCDLNQCLPPETKKIKFNLEKVKQ